MEMDVTSDTVEVLPQHKFDLRSLEAYLNQHLPGFGSDPGAVLTVTQYRYSRLQLERVCAWLCSGWVSLLPRCNFFPFKDASCVICPGIPD